jgi:hypothetical protein
MGLTTTRFLSLLFVSLTLGMTFCRVMEIPGKLRLDGAQRLMVQQHLYVAFGVIGAGIEVLAILLTWVVALQVRMRRRAFSLILGAAICVTGGLVIWALVVAPMNAALNNWTPKTLPADWTAYRDQWEIGHAIHAVLFGLGFTGLLMALMAETVNEPV